MDNIVQDEFIKKKLIYQCQKEIDLIQSEYLRQMFPSSGNQRILSNEELIQLIEELQFKNFKYRTARISSQIDFLQSQQVLQKLEESIQVASEQINQLQRQSQRSQCVKLNMCKYNEIIKETVKYEKKEEIEHNIDIVQIEIKELDRLRKKRLQSYLAKEKILRESIEGLRYFLTLCEENDDQEQCQIFRTFNNEEEKDEQTYF